MDFNSKQCKLKTLSYYESWLGEMGCLLEDRGNRQIYTTERNIAQVGYSTHMDIYIWVEANRIIVSYGDTVKPKINDLKNLKGNVCEVADTLQKIFNTKPGHAIKYFYQGTSPNNQQTDIQATTLTREHYADFEKFWLSCFPDNEGEWLRTYFNDMVKYNFCTGVYIDGILVSCTDAASMPYMADSLQEIGINTLQAYRGQGYAAVACKKAAINILQGERYPIWSHGISNTASQRIAEKIGFTKLADVLMLTI